MTWKAAAWKSAGWTLAAAALIGSGLAIGMHGRAGPLIHSGTDADIEEIRRLLSRDLKDQAERLAALEQRLDAISARVLPDPALVAKVREERNRRREIMADPVRRAAALQDQLHELQTEFEAEAANPYWAAKTSAFIEDALALSRGSSGVAPTNSRVECRSSRCRISFQVSASAEAEDFMMPLLTNLSESLAKTKAVEVVSADGKHVEMHIFAERWAQGAKDGAG